MLHAKLAEPFLQRITSVGPRLKANMIFNDQWWLCPGTKVKNQSGRTPFLILVKKWLKSDYCLLYPTIGSKNPLIFIYFVHRYLPEKKRT
jgi:hypothetical protein